MMAAILNGSEVNLSFYHLGFSHSLVFNLMSWTAVNIMLWTSLISFWLNLMMAAILRFCHVEFRHTGIYGFRHLVIISQIHSKTLSLLWDYESDWLKLIHSSPNLMITVILKSSNLNSTSWIQPLLVLCLLNSLGHLPRLVLYYLHKKGYPLTPLDDGSHLWILPFLSFLKACCSSLAILHKTVALNFHIFLSHGFHSNST